MPWSIDERRWPVVVVGVDGYHDLAAELARVSALHRHGMAFSLVLDVSGVGAPNAAQRRVIADAVAADERHAPLFALAVVTTSPLARGVFKVLHWLVPARHPVELFADPGAAIDWARAMANAARARPAFALSRSA